MMAEQLSGGLRDLGCVEQRDVVIDIRFTDGQLDRFPGGAAALGEFPCDPIVALYAPCAPAAQQTTRGVPIIILSGDPVATGDASLFRRAAWFFHRILAGTKPADLPIEQANDFELLVNLRTARSLGMFVSPDVLGRADEVID